MRFKTNYASFTKAKCSCYFLRQASEMLAHVAVEYKTGKSCEMTVFIVFCCIRCSRLFGLVQATVSHYNYYFNFASH